MSSMAYVGSDYIPPSHVSGIAKIGTCASVGGSRGAIAIVLTHVGGQFFVKVIAPNSR